MRRELLTSINLLHLLVKRFQSDRLTYAAANLTFTSLLALVPLIAVTLAVLSLLKVFNFLREPVQEFIFTNFVPTSGKVVQYYLLAFANQAQNLSWFGLIGLVVTAILMVFTVEDTFNTIWKLPAKQHGISDWLRYWLVLSIAPILLGLSLAISSYIISLPIISGAVAKIGADRILLNITPFVLEIAGLAILYIVLPNCKVPWRYGLIGAVVAAILFEAAKKGFVFYITQFPSYQLIYGALATIPIFLIWIYLSWLLVLLGALITQILTFSCLKAGVNPDIDEFSHAILWLALLFPATQQGRGLTINQLCRYHPGNEHVIPGKQIQALIQANLIKGSASGAYFLTNAAAQLTLKEVYERLPWKLELRSYLTMPPRPLLKYYQQIEQCLSNHLTISLTKIFDDLS